MTPHLVRLRGIVAVVLLALAGCAAEPPKQPDPPKVATPPPPPPPLLVYPTVPVRPVTDVYHGTAVIDPYRYLEDFRSPAVSAIVRVQAALTQEVLQRIPGRSALLSRINQLSDAGALFSGVQIASGKVFYFKLAPGESHRKIFVRDGFQGAERLLVDPAKVAAPEERLSIDYFKASPDAKHVAYAVSQRGSEDSTLRAVEVARGNDLGIVIAGTRYGEALSWHPDGRSLFYNKLPLPAQSGAPIGYVNSVAHQHILGKNPLHDAALFGLGASKGEDLIDIDIPRIVVPQGSSTALAIVQRGDEREISIYAAPAATLIRGVTPWKKVVDRRDQVLSFAAYGQDLFLVSRRDAVHRKVLRLNLASPDMAHAKEVVPQSDKVISEIAVAADALYVRKLVGGIDSLSRLNFKSESFGTRMELVRLKFDMAIRAMLTDPKQPGAVLRLEGWTESPHYVTIDSKSGDVKETGFLPKSPVNFDAYDEVRLFARAKDGQRIPVSMIYKRELMLSRDHPVLLTGYGAYGITMAPSFSPIRMAWLEKGGIFATCHVRGGGEYGELWHRGGQKANKNNSIDDFIACAEFLIERGFTNPQRLAALGGSAGGITVGNAVLRRPDLFAAAVARVGVMDMLRFESTPNGRPNVMEFGTVTRLEDFKWLYETSAFHHVKDGIAYPAVLVTTGTNDPRVEPWNSLKFAVRLQAASSSNPDKKPVLLRADLNAGHSAGVSRVNANEETADIYSFLLWQLGAAEFQPLPVPSAPIVVAPAKAP